MAYIGIVSSNALRAEDIFSALMADSWCCEAVCAQSDSVSAFDTYRRWNAWPSVDLLVIDFPGAQALVAMLQDLQKRFPGTHAIFVTPTSRRYTVSVEGETCACIEEQDIPLQLAALVQLHILRRRDNAGPRV